MRRLAAIIKLVCHTALTDELMANVSGSVVFGSLFLAKNFFI